jgi:hypothetical protein
MKKACLLLVLVTLLAGMSLALELGGKTGLGLQESGFSVRHFVNNNLGFDVAASYYGRTRTGQSDSNEYDYSLGCFMAREIFSNTLLEYGAMVQGWQGSDAGTFYSGLELDPFIGAECFINDHAALDGKVYFGAYSSDMEGGARATSLHLLTGSLNAHIYL